MRFVKTGCNFLFILSIVSFLASCGGSSSSPLPILQNLVNATLTGTVYASSVAGANVVVLNASGSTIAGPVVTAADGSYSISVPSSALSSDLLISSTGGTFTDEATGTTDVAAGTMAAYVAGGTLTSGSKVHLTPSSTIIADLVKNHGKTLTEANTIFSGAFAFTPNNAVAPLNSPTASTAERLAALKAMTFSQLAEDLVLTSDKQFEMLTALAQDLAHDGNLNGSAGSVSGTAIPEDIQNKFEQSLVKVLADTTVNFTSLTAVDIAPLPFSRVALTTTYRIEYVPGTNAAKQGKTQFQIRVTTRNDGLPAEGLTLTLMPKMHMASMTHSTPVDVVTEPAVGTYDCKVYYLMASGASGYWELKVTINTESATFYPAVGSAMGVRATLKGVTDLISKGMNMGTENRSYYLFKDELTGSTGDHTFKLFIAAKESSTSYPPVSVGTTLHDDQNSAWTVNPMTIAASTDGTNWKAVTDNGGGHWSIAGLSGLTDNQPGTIYVRINVNTEQKTIDGTNTGSTNASFAVTPGM